jgi:DnaJ-class molecular chaperone
MAVPCSVNMNSSGSMDSRVACDKCRGLGHELSDWLDKCRGRMDSGMGGSQVDVVVVNGRG